ncbi:MAG TPA: hypothetical protein ENH99_01830 [Candidatus Pacearchaeota archaeon]|nr:hypothetical protein [Candidatus Pacearchaeota archaeon]
MKKRVNGFFLKNRRGQIWVETVIYTLIAFALIGLVLAFAKPKLEEIQDEGLIKQSIKVIEDIDVIIRNIGDAGNQRVLELGISKGTLNIDGIDDKIFFAIESRGAYSQPGEDVEVGNLVVRTEEVGDLNDVTLTRDFSSSYDITYAGNNELKELGAASTPYRLLIKNEGIILGRTHIDLEVIN